MPPLATLTPPSTTALTLIVYLILVALAAYGGGASVAFLALGHRRTQALVSLTGGVMLGVGLLHLLPHAFLALSGQIDTTMAWVLAGFFLMFLLERAFHGHAHHSADGSHACGHDHGTGGPDHGPRTEHHGDGRDAAGRWAWSGALAGLALHSLADGAALAASVGAGCEAGGFPAGFATFLAVLLHKPFDSAIIATLMMKSGASPRRRRLINLAYALVVPAGAALFAGSVRLAGGDQAPLLGAALAMSAGAFLCIAAADLLPEVEFHSHDRLLLTATFTLGITIAWGMVVLERSSHAHAVHAGDIRGMER